VIYYGIEVFIKTKNKNVSDFLMEHIVKRVVIEKEKERIIQISICKALIDMLMMGMINIC
jgi:hypothetical protein